jgi:catechol 2,3-dioxygenase-like lactoylglutathione lyase family enzyme
VARSSPIKTHGLTHVALAVRDPQRSMRFYQDVLGARSRVRERRLRSGADCRQPRRASSSNASLRKAGKSGGVVHFGFRLQRPEDIQHAEDVVRKAGGTIKERGEFVPGEPYVFFNDPDGYEVEIWYEIPTKVDPKPVTRQRRLRR